MPILRDSIFDARQRSMGWWTASDLWSKNFYTSARSLVKNVRKGLTIRSSRPRVVASATCFCATLARVRRPATGRLNSGVRRQKSALHFCFSMLTFPASVGIALRSISCGVASSVKSVWRANTSHALRLLASETVFGVGQRAATHAVISDRSG
jgi:hypothetical protein